MTKRTRTNTKDKYGNERDLRKLRRLYKKNEKEFYRIFKRHCIIAGVLWPLSVIIVLVLLWMGY